MQVLLLVVSLAGVFCFQEALSLSNDIDSPSFLTIGRHFRVITNDTVALPCEVLNVGGYVLVWKRGIAVLTAGATKVTPDARLRLVDGYNLEIQDVQPSDAGEYVCQIGTLQPQEIAHTVEVLVSPRIEYVTSGAALQVKKGAQAVLECRASGNPEPNITWTRKNNVLPSGEREAAGAVMGLGRTTQHHSGVYQCTASNGVGDPDTRQVALNVLYPPEVTVERPWVYAGIGMEAHLVCVVHAQPPPEVLWYRDTLRLDTRESRIMESRGSRHTLFVRAVAASDFGNYSCVALNSLGKAIHYIQLSGKPSLAEFTSQSVGRHRDRYNLTWSVTSHSPVMEYKVLYRKLPLSGSPETSSEQKTKKSGKKDNDTHGLAFLGRGDWLDVLLPGVEPEESQTAFDMAYVISGLEPGTSYEAKVQARNRFGWSQMAGPFHFATKGLDPEVQDLSMKPYQNLNSAASVAIAGLVAVSTVFSTTIC